MTANPEGQNPEERTTNQDAKETQNSGQKIDVGKFLLKRQQRQQSRMDLAAHDIYHVFANDHTAMVFYIRMDTIQFNEKPVQAISMRARVFEKSDDAASKRKSRHLRDIAVLRSDDGTLYITLAEVRDRKLAPVLPNGELPKLSLAKRTSLREFYEVVKPILAWSFGLIEMPIGLHPGRPWSKKDNSQS